MAKKKKNVVRKSRSLLTLLVIIAVAVSWLAVAVTLTDNSEETEQAALVESGKALWADKLYVRAAAKYVSALNNYSTENNAQYETELLALYLEAGYMDEYLSLVSDRREEYTAAEEEYIVCGEWLLDQNRAADAYTLLKEGVERYGSNETLFEMYESIRYTYRSNQINVTDYQLPGTEWIIPATDGKKWGYTESNGSLALEFIYEEATHFDGSYAVVKLDGVYTLIDQSGNWMAVDKVGLDEVTDIRNGRVVGVKDGKYRIYTNTFDLLTEEEYENVYLDNSGYIAVQKDGKWALLDENLNAVTEYQFDDVVPNHNSGFCYAGYAVVKDSGGYYLTNLDGTACFDVRYAAAKGIESGYVAVADSTGKWGFINETGEMMIPCSYSDALSFSCGVAAVKSGLSWGYISRYNETVIEYLFDEAYPFLDGSTIVEANGNTYRLSLTYYGK
ncbi:MAG: WG repeat-containing protein [Lachnospiraceae bacterium]|nr:WG repeat-containing protein [Lachnospiraceae bacterium]